MTDYNAEKEWKAMTYIMNDLGQILKAVKAERDHYEATAHQATTKLAEALKELETAEGLRDHYKLLYGANSIDKLQRIYDAEMNISLSWFFDGGIDVSVGDEFNGIRLMANLPTVSDAIDWLATNTVGADELLVGRKN